MSSEVRLALLGIGVGALLALGGCSAAEETASDQSDQKPMPTEGSPLGVFRPTQSATPDTIGRTGRAAQLTSKQDTLAASVVQFSRSSASPTSVSAGDFVTAFTIQIGAFADASNALTLLKKTKERVGEIPVLNRFEPRDRLYRVSIGLFETREGAIAFQQILIKTHGTDFKDSWVSQISK